jgi:hypothetical protein
MFFLRLSYIIPLLGVFLSLSESLENLNRVHRDIAVFRGVGFRSSLRFSFNEGFSITPFRCIAWDDSTRKMIHLAGSGHG